MFTSVYALYVGICIKELGACVSVYQCSRNDLKPNKAFIMMFLLSENFYRFGWNKDFASTNTSLDIAIKRSTEKSHLIGIVYSSLIKAELSQGCFNSI